MPPKTTDVDTDVSEVLLLRLAALFRARVQPLCFEPVFSRSVSSPCLEFRCTLIRDETLSIAPKKKHDAPKRARPLATKTNMYVWAGRPARPYDERPFAGHALVMVTMCVNDARAAQQRQGAAKAESFTLRPSLTATSR